MSKATRPDTEGSLTCGFYNSINDRKYDANQMSAIFDGVINDGVFASIGTAFVVKADTGNTVTIGTGKAWFNHTWTNNDAILPITCDDSEVLLDRIDAIVIEVNHSQEIRDNRIEIVKGTPSSSPSRPTLTNTESVHQHALCYIYRTAGSTEITQSKITNVVGTDETPFVTGILQVISLDELLGQWQDDLDRFVLSEKQEIDHFMITEHQSIYEFMSNEKHSIDQYMTSRRSEYDAWYSEMKQLITDMTNEVDTWTESEKATILDWFDKLKGVLSSEDVATNLQIQIDNSEIERILMVGLTSGNKTFSEDGTVITTVDSSGRTLTKTFTNNFLTCTTVLTDINGGELGRLVKTFSSDCTTVSSELTII